MRLKTFRFLGWRRAREFAVGKDCRWFGPDFGLDVAKAFRAWGSGFGVRGSEEQGTGRREKGERLLFLAEMGLNLARKWLFCGGKWRFPDGWRGVSPLLSERAQDVTRRNLIVFRGMRKNGGRGGRGVKGGTKGLRDERTKGTKGTAELRVSEGPWQMSFCGHATGSVVVGRSGGVLTFTVRLCGGG
jgi:hypothetical protein